MGHTERIYNRKIKKAQRNNCYHPEEKVWGEMSEEEQFEFCNNTLKNSIGSNGIYYHPYAQVCMGHCKMCKDPHKDQHHLRKLRKREFQKILPEEIECAVLSEPALAVDWDTPEEEEAWKDL